MEEINQEQNELEVRKRCWEVEILAVPGGFNYFFDIDGDALTVMAYDDADLVSLFMEEEDLAEIICYDIDWLCETIVEIRKRPVYVEAETYQLIQACLAEKEEDMLQVFSVDEPEDVAPKRADELGVLVEESQAEFKNGETVEEQIIKIKKVVPIDLVLLAQSYEGSSELNEKDHKVLSISKECYNRIKPVKEVSKRAFFRAFGKNSVTMKKKRSLSFVLGVCLFKLLRERGDISRMLLSCCYAFVKHIYFDDEKEVIVVGGAGGNIAMSSRKSRIYEIFRDWITYYFLIYYGKLWVKGGREEPELIRIVELVKSCYTGGLRWRKDWGKSIGMVEPLYMEVFKLYEGSWNEEDLLYANASVYEMSMSSKASYFLSQSAIKNAIAIRHFYLSNSAYKQLGSHQKRTGTFGLDEIREQILEDEEEMSLRLEGFFMYVLDCGARGGT
jgi:hypothetical protein